jgi:hypothetical protein
VGQLFLNQDPGTLFNLPNELQSPQTVESNAVILQPLKRLSHEVDLAFFMICSRPK